mgnify:CR=1 FL=1
MKNFIKVIMILLSLCVIAGTIATGLSVLNYAGLLDAGTGDPPEASAARYDVWKCHNGLYRAGVMDAERNKKQVALRLTIAVRHSL